MRCPTCHRRLAPRATCPRDGAIAPDRALAADADLAGVAGFVAHGVLGVGGSAKVLDARDANGAAVALKIAHAANDDTRARFAREADALGRIASTAAPRCLASGETSDRRPWLAMERVEGETLAHRLERAEGTGALPPSDVRAIVNAIASALSEVHAAGLVHRDVKPENVVLRADGRATLLDFGLCAGVGDARASLAGPSITRADARIGTAAYMAPEQLAGASVDARADVYALGVVAFELVTGRPPFVGDDAVIALAHASARPPSVSEVRAEVAALDAPIARALVKEAARRYGSAMELARAIDHASRAAVADAVTTETPARNAPQRRPVALLAMRTRAAVDDVSRAVGRFGGQVERVLGDRVVVSFVGAPTPEHGVRAALSALEGSRMDLGASDPIVHVAEVRVRVSGDRTSVAGAILDKPDDWAREGSRVQDDAALTTSAASFVTSATTRATGATTFGREAPIASIVDQARASLAASCALLVTVRGAVGVGKTRVLDEVASRLGSDADVERLAPAPVDARAVAAGLRERSGRRPLVVILDDAQAADASVLDAIELATLDPARLVAIVAATEVLDRRRSSWGFRAITTLAIDLSPLDDASARAMLAERLRPVEHAPEAVVERVVRESRGDPSTIASVAEALHRSGAIRRATSGDGYYLASDEVHFALDGARTGASSRAAISGLSPAVARVAELVAAFEIPPTRALLDACAIDLGADLDGDLGVSLARLERAGVVRAVDAEIQIASPSLRRDLASTTDAHWKTAVHRAAHRAMTALGMHDARRARHALAAGDHDDARDAFADLARLALAAQRFADAEEHATAALAITIDLGTRRALLTLRARARVRLQRFEDAIADLAAAGATGADARELASITLEESTVRDWMHDTDGSAAAADRAAALVDRAENPKLRARLDVARGRTAWRRGALEDARVILESATARATALGDTETVIVAGLVLGSACVYLGKLDLAARVYDDVVARCEASGDRFHLAVACSNRLALWTKLRRAEHAESDLRRAVQIARELGNAQLERISSHNLAELLYLRGDLDAALPLARRSLALQRRFFAAFAIPHDALLVARVLAIAGQGLDEATTLLDEIDARWTPGGRGASIDVLVGMARALVANDAGPAWSDRVAAARERGILDEHAEVLYASVLAAVRTGDATLARSRATDARLALTGADGWLARIDELLAC